MDLNTLWFILIAVLYIGYFFLEGFDYGVGMLVPFISKDDAERRVAINSVGTFWDGNEVWLLTAGGATFAAFPNWYATLFSGFYLALFLMLFGLIIRGVSFEFRSKDESPKWRNFWDWMLAIGSFIPALLWGVAFANFIKGVPIDQTMTYVGGFFNLLNPYALVGGLASLTIFLLHGATFLSIKSTGKVEEKAFSFAQKIWVIAVIIYILFIILSVFQTDMYSKLGINPGISPIIAIVALLAAGYFLKKKMGGWAFIMTALNIVFSVITMFLALYPRVLVSSLNPEWSLTVYNASSSPYTLKVMTIIAAIFVPIVLVYQSWTYYVFRHRISVDSKMEY